jgi:hypothetical protein
LAGEAETYTLESSVPCNPLFAAASTAPGMEVQGPQ